MGKVLKITCASCKREWQCAVGNGLYPAAREEILHAFSGKEREEIEGYLDNGEFPVYQYYNRIGICNCCKNVVSVPVFVTQTEEGKKIFEGSCPLCKKQIRLPEEAWQDGEAEEETCPSCARKTLSVKVVGLWD